MSRGMYLLTCLVQSQFFRARPGEASDCCKQALCVVRLCEAQAKAASKLQRAASDLPRAVIWAHPRSSTQLLGTDSYREMGFLCASTPTAEVRFTAVHSCPQTPLRTCKARQHIPLCSHVLQICLEIIFVNQPICSGQCIARQAMGRDAVADPCHNLMGGIHALKHERKTSSDFTHAICHSHIPISKQARSIASAGAYGCLLSEEFS